MFEALKDQELLKEVLEALDAKQIKTSGQKDSEDKEAEGDQNEVGKEVATKETKDVELKVISKTVSCLARLEQSHMEQNKNLVSENQALKEKDIKKLVKMEEKIRNMKESLGEEDKEEMNLLDRPNPAGSTLLHVSSSSNEGETTRLLLEHGANPNLQDAEGNSPLHIVCWKGDIKTATAILNKNGKLLWYWIFCLLLLSACP